MRHHYQSNFYNLTFSKMSSSKSNVSPTKDNKGNNVILYLHPHELKITWMSEAERQFPLSPHPFPPVFLFLFLSTQPFSLSLATTCLHSANFSSLEKSAWSIPISRGGNQVAIFDKKDSSKLLARVDLDSLGLKVRLERQLGKYPRLYVKGT